MIQGSRARSARYNHQEARHPYGLIWLLALCLLSLAGCQPAAPSIPPAPAVPEPSVTPGSASLAVEVDPPGAQVSVDGEPRGAAPLTLALPAGVHQMGISAAGFAPLTEPVTLTVGQQAMYTPQLVDVLPPTVTVTADPAQIDWLGLVHLTASATDNRDVAGLQLLLNGQPLGEAHGGELAIDLHPDDVPGLIPGAAYTITARAVDAQGNAGQAAALLSIASLAGTTATPATGAGAVAGAGSGTAQGSPTATRRPVAGPPGASTRSAQPSGSATAGPAGTPAGTPAAAALATKVPTPMPTELPEPVTYRVESVVIPTYPYTPYLHTVVDPTVSDYPVLTLDRQSFLAANPQPVPVNYTLLVLENRYVRISILPELGGRIYECVFKPTGHDEFYRNPVIKPTQWGPPAPPYPAGANWWLAAGGLEWGFPVEEHGYEWGTPWGYDHTNAEDGSETVTVFTQDYRRPYVSVAITLPPDSAAFTVQPTIVNPLGAPFRFKWWDNAMVAPGGDNQAGPDVRFIVPGDQVTVHSAGDATLPPAGQAMSWPLYQGRDMSRLGNWREWLGAFARPAAQAGFAAVYDTSADEGVVRIFPPDVVRGVKLYGPGSAKPIDSAEWTDDQSSYVELHGGLAPTFEDWSELAPGEQASWTETWYPAAGTGGLVYATEAGALNVLRSGTGLQVALYPTRPLTGRIEITLAGHPAVTRPVQIAPGRPFGEVFPDVAGSGEVDVALYDEAGLKVLAYRGFPPTTQ